MKPHWKRVIGLVADLHVGSPCAPWPSGFIAPREEGSREIKPSKAQERLNLYWANFCNKLNEFQIDTLLLLGDLVHGNNRREWGKGTMTADLSLQVEACVQLLKPIAKSLPTYAVSGSGYHDSLDVRLDRAVVKELGGEFLGYLANLPLEGTKRIITIQHGASAAAIYREMIMGREDLFLAAAEGRGKLPFHIDMKITGHWHFFCHIHEEGRHLLQLPAWTDWSPWVGSLKYYGKMLPDIGGCILLIDDHDRMIVYPFLYERPMIADGLLEKI